VVKNSLDKFLANSKDEDLFQNSFSVDTTLDLFDKSSSVDSTIISFDTSKSSDEVNDPVQKNESKRERKARRKASGSGQVEASSSKIEKTSLDGHGSRHKTKRESKTKRERKPRRKASGSGQVEPSSSETFSDKAFDGIEERSRHKTKRERKPRRSAIGLGQVEPQVEASSSEFEKSSLDGHGSRHKLKRERRPRRKAIGLGQVEASSSEFEKSSLDGHGSRHRPNRERKLRQKEARLGQPEASPDIVQTFLSKLFDGDESEHSLSLSDLASRNHSFQRRGSNGSQKLSQSLQNVEGCPKTPKAFRRYSSSTARNIYVKDKNTSEKSLSRGLSRLDRQVRRDRMKQEYRNRSVDSPRNRSVDSRLGESFDSGMNNSSSQRYKRSGLEGGALNGFIGNERVAQQACRGRDFGSLSESASFGRDFGSLAESASYGRDFGSLADTASADDDFMKERNAQQELILDVAAREKWLREAKAKQQNIYMMDHDSSDDEQADSKRELTPNSRNFARKTAKRTVQMTMVPKQTAILAGKAVNQVGKETARIAKKTSLVAKRCTKGIKEAIHLDGKEGYITTSPHANRPTVRSILRRGSKERGDQSETIPNRNALMSVTKEIKDLPISKSFRNVFKGVTKESSDHDTKLFAMQSFKVRNNKNRKQGSSETPLPLQNSTNGRAQPSWWDV